MTLLDTNVATSAAMWAGVVGFLSPLVIQQITNLTASRQVQSLLAFVFVLVISVPTAYFAAELDVKDYVKSALVVFTLAMISYKALWNPIGVTPTTAVDETMPRRVG